MLRLLHIENVAVIQKADVEWTDGLNVLTGETGAGKSIVIDALGAILGGKVSRELVRTGADKAQVTAIFTDGGQDWCGENGVDAGDGELLISRTVSADGRSVCRVNGSPVAVQQLRELGASLLDIHGQNDGQRLLDERYHRQYLDAFGVLTEERRRCREAYDAWRAVRAEAQALSMDEREKTRRMETLREQIAELERADVKPGETEEKTARRDLLRNSGRITDALREAYADLYGGERSDGALTLIENAEATLTSAGRWSEELGKLGARLRELRYSAQDITAEVRDRKANLDFFPGELEELEARLELLRRLSRRYGADEQGLLDGLASRREELENMEYAGERLEKLKVVLRQRRAEAQQAAMALRKARTDAAERLAERIRHELAQLNMRGTVFQVEFAPLEEPTAEGMDEVRFVMSANAGEKPGRIAKVASGGELSRIMLAMKSVLSEHDPVESMVFDEIDTGVSGIAAQRVGEKLCALAAARQVICVTHLPQIAAMADTQFCVEKRQQEGRTFTAVLRLDREGRRREIARLTGGENITALTLSAADEQITSAEAYKETRSKRGG